MIDPGGFQFQRQGSIAAVHGTRLSLFYAVYNVYFYNNRCFIQNST